MNEKLLVIDVLKRRLNELKKRKSMILSGSEWVKFILYVMRACSSLL